MRPPSKTVSRAEYEAVKRARDRHEAILDRLANDTPDATERFRVDGSWVTLRLYGVDRGEGGLIHETCAIAGQRDSVHVYG